MMDDRIHFLEEPVGIVEVWREYTSDRSFSPNIWNGGYLAAFAAVDNLSIVTFDLGFRSYRDVGAVLLE